MVNATMTELQRKNDVAWEALGRALAALDGQRRDVFGHLATLGEADLTRRARIPVFAPLLGTDEVPLPTFVGVMFDRHWAAHTEQPEKIRRAAGLPEAKYTTSTTGAPR
jgi:hypothetical protein